MRTSTTPVCKLFGKVNGAVEAQAAIGLDVDVQRLEVGRDIEHADVASLDKVVRDDNVFLEDQISMRVFEVWKRMLA